MTPRERTLAMILIGIIVVGGGATLGYMFVYKPLQEKQAAAQKLQGEVGKLEDQVFTIERSRSQIAEVKRQSLPPDENLAKSQYKLLLEHLLRQAGMTNYTIPDGRRLDNRPPITPEVSSKKPAYTRLEFRIDIKRANAWQVADFLREFYKLDLLHQITFFNITRDNKATDTRNGLEVHLVIEAIILDGAEARSALFPVTQAVSAISGGPGMASMILTPETARKLTHAAAAPVLSTRNRDYSFLALRDMFYVPFPLPTDKPPPPFSMDRLSNVVVKPEDKVPDVKVKLTGEGVEGATVEARASGALFPEGLLKVDPKTFTISFPALKTDLDPSATSTISVTAVSGDGKKTKKESSFKVSLESRKIESPATPKDDIASVIKLTIVSMGSNGTATAVIKDMYNPFKYEVIATPKGVEVVKWYQLTSKTWKKELGYDHPAGVLAIADDISATKRTFKVIALEDDAIILSDIGKPEPKTVPKGPGGGGFGGPGGGVRPPGGGGFARQGPADPLAVIVGNAAAQAPPPSQALYRWTNGKSLKELAKIAPDDAKKILQRAATGGPVSSFAATSAPSGN